MAVDPFVIQITCETCNGTGTIIGEEGATVPDPACQGDGILSFGTVEGADEIADLTDKVNDNSDKLDEILEKLNE
jgi:hypothetical protein